MNDVQSLLSLNNDVRRKTSNFPTLISLLAQPHKPATPQTAKRLITDYKIQSSTVPSLMRKLNIRLSVAKFHLYDVILSINKIVSNHENH